MAIAIHNIPERIFVAIPVFYAMKNRRTAFLYYFASGLLVYLISCVITFIAGIMVYISFAELLPAAHEYGKGHTVAMGIISGMTVMLFSLIVLR